MTCARSFTRYFFLNKLTRFTLCTYSSFFIILRPWIKKFFCFPWVAGFKGSRKKELSSNSPFRLWSPHPFLPVYACISRHFVVLWPWSRFSWRIERLRFTFTPNGKREFVQRDQVFPLIVVKCLLLLLKKWVHASFIHKNCSGQLLSAYFLFWEILYLNLTFPVCLKRDS